MSVAVLPGECAALLLLLWGPRAASTLLLPPSLEEKTAAPAVARLVCRRPGPALLLQTSLLRAMHEAEECAAVTLGDAAPVTLTEPPRGAAGVLVASASPCSGGLDTGGDVVCADGERRRLHFDGRPLRVVALNLPPFAMTVPAAAHTAIAGLDGTLNAGVELQMAALLASRAHMTLEVRDGGAESWLQNLEDLRRGDADACVGSYWAAVERLSLFHMTPPYVWERLRLYVRPPASRPGWQSVFLVFDAVVWALLLLSFGAATLLAARVSDARDWGGVHRIAGATMATLSALLYTAPARAPRRPRLRAVFLLWAAFCLQMDVAFQSALVGFLVNPGEEAGVTSLEQLLWATPPFRATMIERGKEVMGATDDARYEALAASAEVCHNLVGCLMDVQRRRRLAVLAGEQFVRFSVGGAGVRTLDEAFVSYGVVMYLRLHSASARRLCEIVTHAVEAGLPLKWTADLRRGGVGGQDPGEHEDVLPEGLGVGNLQAAFWLLSVGVGGASVALAGEILLGKILR